MLRKWMALLLSAITVTACNSPVYNQAMGNVGEVKLKAIRARKHIDAQAKPLPPLQVKQGQYVDTTPISLKHDPSWLNNKVIVTGDKLPFSYYNRLIMSGAKKDILMRYQTGLDPSTKITMNYSGSIRGALNAMASQTGFVYSVDNNSIYWQAFVSRTFDIAFMPGVSDYLMGKKSGSGGSTASQSSGGQVQNFVSSDPSDAEYSNLSAKLSVWDDLEKTIKQLLSPDGTVSISQATTTVTVKDRPTNVKLIADYIYNLNHNLSKQVLIKIQVLEVTLENDFEFGINWDLVIKAFQHGNKFLLKANYGTPVAIIPFTSQPDSTASTQLLPRFGATGNGYTVLFNALNQQGHTSIVSEPRVVTLNNQVSVVRIVTQNGYIASIQNTSSIGGGSGGNQTDTITSQITPGNLITGITLYVLPKIMGDKIYMQVNADLSTNSGFVTITGGTGATTSSVQLPNFVEKHFNQRTMIRSGETLILSGFRQSSNTANANQFVTSQALGGKGAQQINKETIVLITPIILT